MRQISKDIQLTIDDSPQGFRLTKPDAFSGVEILRLLLRLQDRLEAIRRDGSNVGNGAERRGRFCSSTFVERAEPSPCSA